MTTSARERSSRLAELLRREHSAMADFLLELASFDRERGWEQLGYPSLFSFLRRELRLSAGAAQYRKTAAELVQRFPEVEAALRAGDLCLSSVIELGKVVTAENVTGLLPRFFGLSSRDAAALAVSIRPVQDPPMRELVTAVALPATRAARGAEALSAPTSSPSRELIVESVRAPEVTDARSTPLPPPTKVTPLDAEFRRLNITVSRRLIEKLEAARSALSHSHPGATSDRILEVGLDLVLERHAKRRGLVAKPRAPKAEARPPAAPKPASAAASPATTPDRPGEKLAPATGSGCAGGAAASVTRKRETIPAHVKRAVWLRDGGCCQWPLEGGGGVCGSTLRVEIDHVVPVALGGESTVENCRLACRFHNDCAAREVFGNDHMDRFTRDRAGPSPSTAGA